MKRQFRILIAVFVAALNFLIVNPVEANTLGTIVSLNPTIDIRPGDCAVAVFQVLNIDSTPVAGVQVTFSIQGVAHPMSSTVVLTNEAGLASLRVEGCPALVGQAVVSAATDNYGEAITLINFNNPITETPAISAEVEMIDQKLIVRIQNACGKIVQIYIGSKLKMKFSAKIPETIKYIKLKPGNHRLTVTVKSANFSYSKLLKVSK
jgi:hypothetical protein